MNDKIEAFWQEFLVKAGHDENLRYAEAFYFAEGSSESVMDRLLGLVLDGKKTATATPYPLYKDCVPKVGDLCVITNWEGEPFCVIKTKKIDIRPFKEMTWDLVRLEGEDETLESWQSAHRWWYTQHSKLKSYEFSEEMLIIFEQFEVVYKDSEKVREWRGRHGI